MESTTINSYATDGKCHNAQTGTYGHECEKPAQWIGTTSTGFKSGFCSDCKESGHEARNVTHWAPIEPAPSTPPAEIQKAPNPRPAESTDFAVDIPLSLAVSAYGGVSMSPERRGASAQKDFAETMASEYEHMRAQAVKGGTMDLLPEVFARYRARQASTYRAYLASSSRCVSSFIAGPSNFPAARMNKRNDIAHKRLNEYLDGGKMALQAAIRTLRPDLRAIMSGDADAVDRLTVKIASAERSQAIMKAANKAIRTNAKKGEAAQVSALMDVGLTESQAREIIKPDYCGRTGFADYSLTNNNANIRRMKERLEQISQNQAKEVQAVECANGVTLEDDAPANRVRLFFPGKPDEAIRTELKSSGFRWAPSVGAWQAYRNSRTLETARRMAGEVVREKPQEDAYAAYGVTDNAEAETEPTTPAMESQPIADTPSAEFLAEREAGETQILATVAKWDTKKAASAARACTDDYGPSDLDLANQTVEIRDRKAAPALGMPLCPDARQASTEGVAPTIKSKSGKWCAWLLLTWDNYFGLEFEANGKREHSTHASASDRMAALQAMALAVDAPDDSPPDGGSRDPITEAAKQADRGRDYWAAMPESARIDALKAIGWQDKHINACTLGMDLTGSGNGCNDHLAHKIAAIVEATATAPMAPVAVSTPGTPSAVSSASAKMRITEIRKVIDFCDWVRNDFGGATASEFKAMDMPGRLKPHIEAVKSLEIPPQFTKDIERQAWAIECAQKAIARWQSKQ